MTELELLVAGSDNKVPDCASVVLSRGKKDSVFGKNWGPEDLENFSFPIGSPFLVLFF